MINEVAFKVLVGTKQRSAGTARLSTSGLVRFIGVPKELQSTLEQRGVVSSILRKRVFPPDGADFLRACTMEFNGPKIVATNVPDATQFDDTPTLTAIRELAQSIEKNARPAELPPIIINTKGGKTFRKIVRDDAGKIVGVEEDTAIELYQGQPRDKDGQFDFGKKTGEKGAKQGPLDDAIALLRADKENRAKVERRAASIAEEMGHTGKINVVDDDPRPFEVGGIRFHEAGHYDPTTREIQINARVSTGDRISQTTGIVAHEISHAQYHTVRDLQDAEHESLGELFTDQKYFSRSGFMREEVRPELEQKYPASALFGKVGLDAYFSSDADYKAKAVKLRSDDGVSTYSRAYWQTSALDTMGGYERAIDETVAEITRLKFVPTSRKEGDTAPTDIWREFADGINTLGKGK